jgi:hypothetical protein
MGQHVSLIPPDDTPTYATASGDCSSARATTLHENASVQSHGYEQSARYCCLVINAGAAWAPIARRRTLAARPRQERVVRLRGAAFLGEEHSECERARG